jgi:hypothetical protein
MDDADGEFLVARLVYHQPTTARGSASMAQTVHEMSSAAIEAEPRPCWWRCRVLNEPSTRADYFKTDSRDRRRSV